ncbi:lysosomal acid phosphatase-like [Centruroides sculpturatus]|uniref:lysosomal acid phosphatase-like n=1 Tax=Centruroides sculpturatus TaxID=218467 RepID=UPI000C6EB918|nr:lysosomal acid phosphatase-like [Centruroides sculpturatus]
MLPFYIILTLFGSLLCQEDVPPVDHTASLQLLHIIVRHGARTPISLYPNDPNVNYEYKEGNGQLTNTGKLQQYTLGKYFRERYANYISSNPRELVARSSQKDRTIISGLCHLAGLYAPKEEWQFSEELNWQPIRILTSPPKTDGLLYEGAVCPEAKAEQHRIRNSPEGEAYRSQFTELFNYVTNHSGMTVDDWETAADIFSTLKIEKSHNLIIPDWVTDEVYQKLQEIFHDSFYYSYKTTKVQRLRAGVLIGDMTNHMQERNTGQLNNLTKVYAYFTHDANIAALLNALKIFNGRAPPFCAAIVVEFHKIQDTSCVKVFYSNATNPESGEQRVHLMTLPDCGLACCPLDTFVAITRDLVPVDWEKECQLQTEDDSGNTEISRHGARTPIILYPNDPNKNHRYKEGLGQLTNTGKLQQYALGKYFRKRYHNFITSNPREVVARSSQTDRTITSGLCHLSGLYAPSKEWRFTEEINWQPIKILTSPRTKDKLLYAGAECPEADAELARIKNSPRVKVYKEQHKELFQYVSHRSGIMVDDWLGALLVFDAIKIHESNDASVPHWVTPRVYRQLEKITQDFFYYPFRTVKMQRLRAGPLIGDIVDRMRERDEGKLNNLTKVYAYFTHDANIAVLLNALKIFNGRAPPFCATVLIELHKMPDASCVKVFYSNATDPESGEQRVHLMTLPDCGLDCCPLPTFTDITRPLVPVDWEKECRLSNSSNSGYTSAWWIRLDLLFYIFALYINFSS